MCTDENGRTTAANVPDTGWTPQQLADNLGISVSSVRKHKEWPRHRAGNGRIRYMADDVRQIREWLQYRPDVTVLAVGDPAVTVRQLRRATDKAS